MIEPAHLVGTGGAIGAILRYAAGLLIVYDRFPFSTLLVNVVGSFVLGFVTFLGLNDGIALFVGTGACGSFTTYSSFSYETVRLWETEKYLRAVIYALGTLGLCLLATALAAALASMVRF